MKFKKLISLFVAASALVATLVSGYSSSAANDKSVISFKNEKISITMENADVLGAIDSQYQLWAYVPTLNTENYTTVNKISLSLSNVPEVSVSNGAYSGDIVMGAYFGFDVISNGTYGKDFFIHGIDGKELYYDNETNKFIYAKSYTSILPQYKNGITGDDRNLTDYDDIYVITKDNINVSFVNPSDCKYTIVTAKNESIPSGNGTTCYPSVKSLVLGNPIAQVVEDKTVLEAKPEYTAANGDYTAAMQAKIANADGVKGIAFKFTSDDSRVAAGTVGTAQVLFPDTTEIKNAESITAAINILNVPAGVTLTFTGAEAITK